MKAVVDASFLLALIPGDPDHDVLVEAYPRIRRRAELLAPDLIVLETGNAIHGRRRASFGATFAERRALHRSLLERVRLDACLGLDDACAALAERHLLSFYDARYLALAALDGDAVLFTQDRRLHAAARRHLGASRAFSVPEAADAFGGEVPS